MTIVSIINSQQSNNVAQNNAHSSHNSSENSKSKTNMLEHWTRSKQTTNAGQCKVCCVQL